MSSERKRCFVIMPFSKTNQEHTEEYWNGHFESFLKPLIEEISELEAHRSEPLRGDLLKQIITELVVSPVVVADLTDANPNVFWELGVRQSFKHGTVTIAEKGVKIPFDISVKSTLFYHPKDHLKNAKFRARFKKALADCLSDPNSPDSQVLESVSGRGTLFEIVHLDEAIRRVKALVSEYKRNMKNLEDIYARCEKNQKTPKQREYSTVRFILPSLELLVTNRYLDEDDNFYLWSETIYSDLWIRNDQLAIWEQKPDSTEKWFLATKKEMIDDLKTYGGLLRKAQKKLSVRI